MRQVVVKMSVALALVAAGYAVGRAQTSFSIVSGVVPAELAKVTETGPWGDSTPISTVGRRRRRR